MDKFRCGVQVGAAALALGFTLAGPQIALATADESDTAAAGPSARSSIHAARSTSAPSGQRRVSGQTSAVAAIRAPVPASGDVNATGLLGQVLQAGAVELMGDRHARRGVSAAAPAASTSKSVAGPVIPITTDATNSFTTIFGSTAAGSVTANGHTWVADPTTHLYSTTTDLAQQWQGYYAQMKAGQGASLNDIQRLEGNAEAVFENTGLKNLTAAQLVIARQDLQRQFDAMYAAMVGAGVNLNAPLTQQQYLATESVLQSNPTLLELGVQGHGLNKPVDTRYSGYTTDFQNRVDNQTLYIGGGLNNGSKAIATFLDDNILTHMPFGTVANNGVLYQLNQNGNRDGTIAQAVSALDSALAATYTSADFLQPPQVVNQTAKQVFINGQAFSLTLSANTFVELQGQTMTYTATLADNAALPTWVTFNSQTMLFTGTAPAGTTSSRVYVTATNSSGLHTTESFAVQFNEPAPVVANPTPNQKVASVFGFTLPANTFVDPLGESMTYSASTTGGAALPTWLSFNAQTGLLSGKAPAGTKSLRVVVTATNSSGVKTSEAFAIQFV